MSFDPEKVERYEPESGSSSNAFMGGNPAGTWVQLLDYYQLLALYREARGELHILRESEAHRRELIERQAIVQRLQDRLDGKQTGTNDGPPDSIILY